MKTSSDTSGIRFGLTTRVFAASTLLVVAVLGLTFGLTSVRANRSADEAVHRALANTRRAATDFLAARTRTLASLSRVSGAVPQFRERLLTSRDRADVLDQATEYRSLIGAAWILVTDNDGILRARTDYPEQYDLDLSRGALIGGALSGTQTAGAWVDDAAHKLFMAVATPLAASAGGSPEGVLVAAYALDDSLAQAVKVATNSDVVLVALDAAGHPYVVGTTLPADQMGPTLRADSAAIAGLARDSSGVELAADVSGERLIGLAAPIRSAGGDLYGAIVPFRSRDAELAAFRALQRTMTLAIALGVALALALAFVIARQITRPVRDLAVATRRVQDGDYSVEIVTTSRDEIGALSRAFKRLVEDLREKAALVEYMSAATGGVATQLLERGAREPRRSTTQGGEVLRPGALFANRYDVQAVLGIGGMGVVYRAFDRELQETVAIKTLRPEAMAGESAALERFRQEIRLARKITHRNVVRTYDLGETDGLYYLTMEYVEGASLKDLIRSRGRLPIPVTLTIGKQLCRALEVAHEQGVIHRDIKPQNIVVEPSGFLKVMDFGIARLANPPQGKGLTQEGTSIGTPDYMAPEQLSGMELDARSDLYAAGVVLFECVTGRVPFEAETTWALIAKHLEEEPPDPRQSNPDVPESLSRVILKAMAKAPVDRYQSANEMYAALAAVG
ncbi:MAG TPA: protein kinase [Gemmatimonadales bacterium]|nr:protein kinase [Gemmatimonadales bacterium]